MFSLQDPVVLSRTVDSPDLVVSSPIQAACDTEMRPEVYCLRDKESQSSVSNIRARVQCPSLSTQSFSNGMTSVDHNVKAPNRNPGHSKPGRVGKRAKVQEPPRDPETKPWHEAVERLGKSVSILKAAHDRASRDLSSVRVIESKLKAKKWDTSGPIDYLHAEAQKVPNVNEQMLSHWLEGEAYISAVKRLRATYRGTKRRQRSCWTCLRNFRRTFRFSGNRQGNRST